LTNTLSRIANKLIYFGWSIQPLIHSNVIPVVQSNFSERKLTKLPNRVSLSTRNYVVPWLRHLKHQMHCLYIILSMTPVPPRLKVSEPYFIRKATANSSHSVTDLACHKLASTTGTFVIKQNAATTKHAIRFAVVLRKLKSSHLADAVWAPWVKWRCLSL